MISIYMRNDKNLQLLYVLYAFVNKCGDLSVGHPCILIPTKRKA